MLNTSIMPDPYHLERFKAAQSTSYASALMEIRQGRKQTHWMWYIFPQIQGLGFSDLSKFYAIKNIHEAEAYLKDPLLGSRLVEISNALLSLPNHNARLIMGNPDDVKLKSCMTLFAALPGTDPVFQDVLEKFFQGVKDDKTLQLLNSI